MFSKFAYLCIGHVPLQLITIIMPIPKEILAVVRPSSTVVKRSGERWIVIKRTSKRVGKKVMSVDLGVIGEIINYEYHEIRKLGKREEYLMQMKSEIEIKNQDNYVDEKDLGQIELCHLVASDLIAELEPFFGTVSSRMLYCMAVMRVSYNDIRDRDFALVYRTSYLSNLFPGLHMGEDTISKFLYDIGLRVNDIDQYMAYRINKFSSSPQAIDGMLKDSDATTNSFCEFSRKARVKGIKNYSQIFIFNLDTMEPTASYQFPGNMLDLTSFKDVLSRSKLDIKTITWKEIKDDNGKVHKVPSTLLMGDKGFYDSEVIKELEHRGIPYLLPLKRDSKYITDYGMYNDIVKYLSGYNFGCVYYKKSKTSDGHYLYTYKDLDLAAKEEKDYLGRKISRNQEYENEIAEKRKEFGTLTFISSVDIEPIVAYLAYLQRWNLEDLFYLFKCTLDLDTLNVRTNYRLYATEFVNFLSAIIASRVWKLMQTTILRKKRVKIEYQNEPNPEDQQVSSAQDSESESVKDALETSKKNKKNKKVPKTKLKNVYVSDEYSFKQIMLCMSKVKTRRVGYTDEWKPILTINKLRDLCKILGVSVC